MPGAIPRAVHALNARSVTGSLIRSCAVRGVHHSRWDDGQTWMVRRKVRPCYLYLSGIVLMLNRHCCPCGETDFDVATSLESGREGPEVVMPTRGYKMAKFKGLDQLTKKIEALSAFAKELDGDIAKVSFDPDDPGSIDRAIAEVEVAIDAKAASYGSNDWVEKIVVQVKENFRARILERAAAARLERDD